jgi:hypothetical protein
MKNDFATIHRQLLRKPTISEHQIASRIAKTIDNDNKDTVDNLLVKTRLDKESKCINSLITHYIHEKRLATYKKDIHKLWNQTFTQTPLLNTWLIIGNRNNQNMTKQPVCRRSQTSHRKSNFTRTLSFFIRASSIQHIVKDIVSNLCDVSLPY